jgi:hypothetical protein
MFPILRIRECLDILCKPLLAQLSSGMSCLRIQCLEVGLTGGNPVRDAFSRYAGIVEILRYAQNDDGKWGSILPGFFSERGDLLPAGWGCRRSAFGSSLGGVNDPINLYL